MKKLIVIDPGHGGHDPGAVGPTGLKEADVVLTISNIVADLLADAGVGALLTRDFPDEFVSLSSRADFANQQTAPLISIHCNSAANRSARGFEVFTSPSQTESDRLATSIFNAQRSEFPESLARVDMSDGDPDKEARFTVLTATKGPAVLVETEFISNPAGEDFLRDNDILHRIASYIAGGTLQWLGVNPPAPPPSPAPPDNIAIARQLISEGLALLPA